MTKIVELIISEEEKEDQDGVFAISLVEDPAIDEYWVALNKQQKDLKFAKIDEEKRLLIAPALVPNKQIFRLDDDGSDYHVYFSKDTIKKCSELYMKRNHLQSATLEHESKIDGICVVESWIKEFSIDKSVKYGFEHCPIGTWFVTMKVDNDEIWNKVKDGEILGFSIEGFFTDKMQELSSKSLSQEDLKISKIIDIINDAESKYSKTYPIDDKTSSETYMTIKNRVLANSVIPKVRAILSERKKRK